MLRDAERRLINLLAVAILPQSSILPSSGAKKAYDKEALATAWNADIRMKNIWKAIEARQQALQRQSRANRNHGRCCGPTEDNHSKVAPKTPAQARGHFGGPSHAEPCRAATFAWRYM